MARLGRERSGMPPEEEFAAMKQRTELLKKAIGDSKLLVYSVQANSGSSEAQTAALTSALGQQSWAKVAAAKTALTRSVEAQRSWAAKRMSSAPNWPRRSSVLLKAARMCRGFAPFR